MLRKFIIRDLIGAVFLLAGCLIAGLVLNATRSAPLPLAYSPPETRLPQTASAPLDADIDLNEMQKLSRDRGALIIDARPDSLYRLGHIPAAVNLPRADFDTQYQALQSALQSHHDQTIAVYCSGTRCPDSQIIATALQKLGYPHVRIYLGGWSEWQSANLPEEKE